MQVLIVGSGGREHAIAWKLARSPDVSHVMVAPGNGGTASDSSGKVSNVTLDVSNFEEVAKFCKTKKVGLCVVGPEQPLADGLADVLWASGIRTFGPCKAAAHIEGSKAFSKHFMKRHNIPTAEYACFTDYDKAVAYVKAAKFQVVIKASGLAAGKGVLLPETVDEGLAALKAVMLDKEFGQAGDEVVIEERLEGPEASILAFSDGHTVVTMPAAQDHKRIFAGDKGPNTGGMGAYCPAPVVTPALTKFFKERCIQPAIDGLRKEGRPFVGCLFTGLMLDPKKGPQVLEYNCRFGDPETQVVLPLLDTDLFKVMLACCDRCLDSIDVRFKPAHAATVVMASKGYPGKYPKGCDITGAESVTNATVFHAGTKLSGAKLQTSGGRVLSVSAVGEDLRAALKTAYAGVAQIQFEGAQFRADIAHRALKDEEDKADDESQPAKKRRVANAPVRLGILGSTRGSSLQPIIDAIAASKLNARVSVIVSNKKKSGILERAAKHSIASKWLPSKGKSRADFDASVTQQLEEHDVELVLLIGYMRIVSDSFVERWRNRMLNVHPSLLPKHPGLMDLAVHQAVLDAKETDTGCTVHFVDEKVDGGAIAVQKSCKVLATDTAETLKARVQVLEGVAFIEAIEAFRRGTLFQK